MSTVQVAPSDAHSRSALASGARPALGAGPCARPSPQLVALLAQQTAHPPTPMQLRRRDNALRSAMRRHPASVARRRQWRLAREDPAAMANNRARLQRLEHDYEAGRRPDTDDGRPFDLDRTLR